MARVAVLLSSYNGARFIHAQIVSILADLPADGALLIRDDGSEDGTLAEIARVSDPRLQLVESGPNLGFVASFFRLMALVPADCAVVMLSDQDDIWLPGKIARACTALAAHGPGPVLYSCRPQPVDERLQPLPDSYSWPRGPSFANALTENIITGCACAFNRAALETVLALRAEPRDVLYHDWWLYLVISAVGRVVMDDARLILWRRHAGASSLKLSFLGLVDMALAEDGWMNRVHRQNQAFYRLAGHRLSPEHRTIMERWCDFGRPIAFAFSPQRWRQTMIDELLLRTIVLLRACLPGRRFRPYSPQR